MRNGLDVCVLLSLLCIVLHWTFDMAKTKTCMTAIRPSAQVIVASGSIAVFVQISVNKETRLSSGLHHTLRLNITSETNFAFQPRGRGFCQRLLG